MVQCITLCQPSDVHPSLKLIIKPNVWIYSYTKLGYSYILLCNDYYLKTGEIYQFEGYGELKLKGRKRS